MATPVPEVEACVVGGGLGALMAHTALRFRGLGCEDVAVVGAHDDPFATYRRHAWGVGQRVTYADPLGHFLPADWPGPAVLDVVARPGMASLRRLAGGGPAAGVADTVAQARAVARRLGYVRSFTRRVVADVVRATGPAGPHFGVYADDGALVLRARHVLLALGHGPPVFPPVLDAARGHPLMRDRVVHAYEPKRYVRGGRYLVIGAGLAAVNEWVNALAAGAECIAVRRPDVEGEDLGAPQCLFEALGIDAYSGLTHDQRLGILGRVLRGATASGDAWRTAVIRGHHDGRFREVVGEVTSVAPGPSGLVADCALAAGGDTGPLHVTGVTVATGFDADPRAVPLLARLVLRHAPPMTGGRLALPGNCGLVPVDQPASRLCVAGFHAALAVPHADTLAGLKYVARRFADDVVRARGGRGRGVGSRARMHAACVGSALGDLRRTPVTA